MKLLRSLVVFLAVCLYVAFVAWCGGYNFDERGLGVALIVGWTGVFAGFAAAFLYAWLSE